MKTRRHNAYLLFILLFCLCLRSFAEVGNFTATLPETKPGDPPGNFEVIVTSLCGRGFGTFTDTKTGHYKYMVTGGDVSVNTASCNGSTTSYWSTKKTSEETNFGNFTRYGIQVNSLQVLQSFNSKVQNSILNAKNNSNGTAYECDTNPNHEFADLSNTAAYNWILLRPRTPEEGVTLSKNYSDPLKNRAGGSVYYTQSGGISTLTGTGSFDLSNLTNANTAYSIGPQGAAICDTSKSASQPTTNTGANYFDQFGTLWFGKLDAASLPQAAIYTSTKSSPLVAFIAPKSTLDETFMSELNNNLFATMITSWSSKTLITTKTAMLTPNADGTNFTINTITNLDSPTTSSVPLANITCPEENWNLPSPGFCKGTITLSGVAGTGNSVCMISNVGTQKVISCIAQNPSNPAYAITLIATYSKKANIAIQPSYAEGTGCKTFSVSNLSNRQIPTIATSATNPLVLPWYFGPNTFSGANGYCGTSMVPYESCNIDVCNNDATVASSVTTVRLAYDDDADPTTIAPAATTAAVQIPQVQNKIFSSPDGLNLTCKNTTGTASFTNAFQLNVDYGNGNIENLSASPDTSSFFSLSLSNYIGYSLSSNKLNVDCSNPNVQHMDQVTVYYRYYPDGDVTTNDGSLTITIRRDDDGDNILNPADNCPTVANTNQTDTDTDTKGDACDNCPSIANSNQTDTDADTKGDACDNCPTNTNSNQTDTDADTKGDACDNCPTDANSNQIDTDADAKGDVCDNCITVSNSSQTDTDSDEKGDACDNCPSVSNSNQDDPDNDGVGTVCDNCPAIANSTQTDTDADTVGNVCDNCSNSTNTNQADEDSDGIGTVCDNCPAITNTDQADIDSDIVGTVCDNCPTTSNAEQADFDSDGDGDACDNCLTVPNSNQADSNNNGKGDLCDNLWAATSVTLAPSIRSLHTAIWTGSKMIVFGGVNGNTNTNTGGLFDPSTNSWTAISLTNAPTARHSHTAVWTDSNMIVFGGVNGNTEYNSGGKYDPITNTWSLINNTTAPSPRLLHSATWTGNKMVIFGGKKGATTYNSGGQYDPSTNTWSEIATTNSPARRYSHTAVWTGSKMVVFGGEGSSRFNTGGIYDPIANSWTVSSTTNAPVARTLHTSVWTGSKMIVFGGANGNTEYNSGGQYDPAANSWSITSTIGAPSKRTSHTAVWTGSKMVIFGGNDGNTEYNTGGQYDPSGNSWSATSTSTAPSPRLDHTAVWDGLQMHIFGGTNGTATNSGGSYYP